MSVRNILDGSISVSAEVPEILEVTRLSADSVVTVGTAQTGVSSMSPSRLSISQVNAIDSVTTDNLTVEDTATTKNLTVTGGITMEDVQVLTQTYADLLRPLTVTYSDDSTGTPTAIVHTKVCNINNEQHLLTCQLELKGLSKAITEMIIPTVLTLVEDRQILQTQLLQWLMEQK